MNCTKENNLCIKEWAKERGAKIDDILDGYLNPICNFCIFNSTEDITTRIVDTKLYLQSDKPIELKHQFGRQTKKKKSAGGAQAEDIKEE